MFRKSLMQSMVFVVAIFGVAASAAAQYEAKPWTFVGTVNNCGSAGAKIVTSSWQNGMGLPDNGTSAHPNGKNAHQGLLLSKNGPTANCASAGADILGITAGDPISGLGFDFRRGGHCGAGAPRFNVYTSPLFTHGYFFGCGSSALTTHADAPQDPAQWERVTFTGPDGSPFTSDDTSPPPPWVFGVTPVYFIEIVYDEGTDTANNDTQGVGLAVIDNILINTTRITKKGSNPITP